MQKLLNLFIAIIVLTGGYIVYTSQFSACRDEALQENVRHHFTTFDTSSFAKNALEALSVAPSDKSMSAIQQREFLSAHIERSVRLYHGCDVPEHLLIILKP